MTSAGQDPVVAGAPTDFMPATAATVGKGISWSVLGRVGSQAVQFASGLVLVRLLSPADFGTIAAVYVVAGLMTLFFEVGLAAALVHLAAPTQRDFSTAFWLNAIGGVVLSALLWMLGPFLGDLINKPASAPLFPLVGLIYTLYLGICHRAILERRLDFRTIARIELISTTLGWAGALAAAFAGFGVYSLVLAPLVRSVLTTVLLWVTVPWHPQSFLSLASVARLSRFTGGLFASNLVAYVGQNVDNLVLARASAATLGYYSRAYSLMLLPVYQVQQVLLQVLFPTLASLMSDQGRFREAYRRAVRASLLGAAPMLVGMAVTAPALVDLLWGDQWTESVDLLRILCLAGVAQCVTATSTWPFQATGQPVGLMWLGVARLLLLVLLVLPLVAFGARGVAVAVLLSSWLCVPLYIWRTSRLVKVGASLLIRDVARPVLLAATVGGLTAGLTILFTSEQQAESLLMSVPLGLTLSILSARVFMWDVVQDITAAFKR